MSKKAPQVRVDGNEPAPIYFPFVNNDPKCPRGDDSRVQENQSYTALEDFKPPTGPDGRPLPFVIVRTFSAGVHCGYLVARDGTEVYLAHSRRIWKFFQRWSLNEMANTGLGDQSKVAQAVEGHVLTQAVEILYCTPTAERCLLAQPWCANS